MTPDKGPVVKYNFKKSNVKSDKMLRLLILHQEQVTRIDTKGVILKSFIWKARTHAIKERGVLGKTER